MIKWLKQHLGVTNLETELSSIKEEKQELEKALSKKENEIQTFRQKEEADKAKYESPEPWVEIRSADFSEVKGIQIALDWNDAFIQNLKESGLKGSNDEEIVQKWLAFLYQDLVQRLESKSIDLKAEDTNLISDYE